LLKCAKRIGIGVDYIAFENLFLVKKKSKVRSPNENRKIAKFALIAVSWHGIIMTLKPWKVIKSHEK